ncbi:MAG TPA: hypothetical protein VEU72_00610, partial [Nitrosopumilaceae archaeon]|nr:hypothetical protein [Nitrosopumilaceae archaeon]
MMDSVNKSRYLSFVRLKINCRKIIKRTVQTSSVAAILLVATFLGAASPVAPVYGTTGTPPSCPTGMTFESTTHLCESSPTSCPSGSTLNPTTGICES